MKYAPPSGACLRSIAPVVGWVSMLLSCVELSHQEQERERDQHNPREQAASPDEPPTEDSAECDAGKCEEKRLTGNEPAGDEHGKAQQAEREPDRELIQADRECCGQEQEWPAVLQRVMLDLHTLPEEVQANPDEESDGDVVRGSAQEAAGSASQQEADQWHDPFGSGKAQPVLKLPAPLQAAESQPDGDCQRVRTE